MYDRRYYVYILRNFSDNLYYTGVTNNLIRRAYEHKEKLNKGFSQEYNINQLVYYEEYNDIKIAIQREKQLKDWNRSKKKKLILLFNPEYKDFWNDIVK